jgi:hypothetical protein
MATFLDLQTQVKDLLVDLPLSVKEYVKTLIREAIKDLQIRHNYRVMRAAFVVSTTINNHVVGNLPGDWKQPRRNPWYTTAVGDEREIAWIGNEEDELFRRYAATDVITKGAPAHLFARTVGSDGTLQLEVYPLPDGLSDWTDESSSFPVGEYNLYVPYYRYMANLELDTDANWFTVHASRAVVSQAAAQGFLKNWDEQRAAVHSQLATVHERILRRQDAALAGPPERAVAVRSDVYGSRRSLGMRW